MTVRYFFMSWSWFVNLLFLKKTIGKRIMAKDLNDVISPYSAKAKKD